MDNKDFDKNIKDRLTQLGGSSAPTDWNQFSKILSNEEEFKDLRFDQAISDALKGKKLHYNSLHWIQLKNRLKKEARLRKEVFTTKIFESILVLLLTFTFVNLDQHFQFSPQLPEDPVQMAVKDALKYPEFSGLIPISKPSKLKSQLKPVVSIQNKSSSGNEFVITQNEELDSKNLSIKHIPLKIIKLNVHSVEPTKLKPKSNLIPKNLKKDIFKSTNSGREIVEVEKLSPINGRMSNLDDAYPVFYYPKEEENSHSYFISSTVNSNLNIVRSPEDPIFGVDDYNIYDPGLSVGIGVGTIHGNYELSTGVSFERMEYRPLKITEFTSADNGKINKSSLDKIKFDIVSVPVNLRYHLNPDNKTHFWMGIGVGLNMAIWSDYDIGHSKIDRLPNNYDRSVVNLSNRGNETYLNKKNFHDGFLENGHFFDNFFLSSYAEIGISRKVNELIWYNAFVGYSTTFTNNGIGPNFDTFDALRFGLGVSYRI